MMDDPYAIEVYPGFETDNLESFLPVYERFMALDESDTTEILDIEKYLGILLKATASILNTPAKNQNEASQRQLLYFEVVRKLTECLTKAMKAIGGEEARVAKHISDIENAIMLVSGSQTPGYDIAAAEAQIVLAQERANAIPSEGIGILEKIISDLEVSLIKASIRDLGTLVGLG